MKQQFVIGIETSEGFKIQYPPFETRLEAERVMPKGTDLIRNSSLACWASSESVLKSNRRSRLHADVERVLRRPIETTPFIGSY